MKKSSREGCAGPASGVVIVGERRLGMRSWNTLWNNHVWSVSVHGLLLSSIRVSLGKTW